MKKVCRDNDNDENFSDSIANNVLRLSVVFYLGFGAQSCRQKYCNKINQISTENYIAIFLFAQTFCELQS